MALVLSSRDSFAKRLKPPYVKNVDSLHFDSKALQEWHVQVLARYSGVIGAFRNLEFN